jgi:hypothetical protein
MSSQKRLGSPTLFCVALAAACSADGAGDLAVRVSGEEGALSGFPSSEFSDGWSVSFSKYLVAVGDLEVASSDGSTELDESTIYIVDLHAGEPTIEIFEGLGARRWDRFSFSVRAPQADDEVIAVGNVAPSDVDAMVAGRFNYAVEGTATHSEGSVSFAWGLANGSRNRDCTSGSDETQGVVVPNNSRVTAEITFHVEHLFWDALGSEQTEQRFEAIAAMADDQGIVEFDALANQGLADLRNVEGEPLTDVEGNRIVYDPGSSGAGDLRAFILAATRTQAHLDGGGLCTIAPL